MSTTLAHGADFDAQARRRITLALDGPVMATLMGLMPELAGLPRERALEIILCDCGLLHRCFQAFRAQRERFRDLLIDRRHRPVDNDNTQLICGRSVNQAIAMIVRSAAKRHFRLRLDRREAWGGRSRLAAPTGAGWGGMLAWMSERPAPPREKSAADQLYDAIRQYLLHDWQVPIIPQYARMSPPEVRALGSRILDFRDAGELAGYLDGGLDGQPIADQPITPVELAPTAPAEPMPIPPPLAQPVVGHASLPSAPMTLEGRASLGKVLSSDGRSLRMDAMIPILVRPEIKAALGEPSQPALLQASRALALTGSNTVRRLAVDFGLPAEQMATMLTAAALALPHPVFERLFGRHSDAALVLALVRRAKAAGLTPASPPAAFAAFMRALFGRFGH